MRNPLKLLLITLPLVAAGAGVVAWVVATSPPPERAPLAERAAPVRIVTATQTRVVPKVIGFGLVSPARTFEAIAQVGGTVEYVNPDLHKGAILPAGAVLVRMSPADFNLAIAQAMANIRAAEARLAELAVSEANQTSALAIEKEALALKAADLERAETLFANGTVPQTTRDAARAAHLVQRQKVQGVESSRALLPTQRAVQEEQIAVYRASLETARLNLERTELILPFAARVATVSVESGQYLRVGQTAVLLDGVGAAEVEAQVPVAALRSLLQSALSDAGAGAIDLTAMSDILQDLGLSAQVNLRLGGDVLSWPATVDRFSDTIDPKTGTLGVIVRVETAYSGMKPGKRPPLTKGMFVEAELSAEPLAGILVPRHALHDGWVHVADAESRLRLAPVSTLLSQDDFVLIGGGLEPGARIVVSSLGPVIDGMLLDVTEDTGLMAQMAAEAAE